MFSWHQISIALMSFPKNRIADQSVPVIQVKDFNIWFEMIAIIGFIYTMMAWQGTQAFNASAASPHEQKMGDMLGGWRGLVFEVMQTLLAICALTYLTNHDFASGRCRGESAHLPYSRRESRRAEIFANPDARADGAGSFSADRHQGNLRGPDVFPGLHQRCFLSAFVGKHRRPGRHHAVPQRTVFSQGPHAAPAALHHGRHNFGFCWSLFYHQVGYIKMYLAVTGAIFLGGAGSVIIGGLYWKKGTTPAAWTALITGGLIAVSGIYLDHYWIDIQPHLLRWYPHSDYLIRNPEIFPINGQWVSLITMGTSIFLYTVVSLLTCRKDFNLERMLHRGQYAVDANGNPAPVPNRPPRTLTELLGIDGQFTRGDKILAGGMFCYTMGWFLVVAVISLWNLIKIWPDQWWSNYWYYAGVIVPIVLGTVTSVWFTIGGVRDLQRLFRRLKTLQRNPDDDGRVPMPNDDASAPDASLVKSA